MPTPSIQTLRTDAQQVLNLDSISAVRSVVAATLANANAGTPLNPNLTTQQLWNEFYQIVTQPKSDIESIIANQLMKFMYAPPAPGGAGANHEVIYNNNGVLAGDSKFLWDDALNRLDIDGSATISGDLTVDTSTLKVDSTNNRVGIGTASPATILDIQSAGGVFARIQNTTSTADAYLLVKNTTGEGFFGINATGPYVYTAQSLPITFTTATSERYRIAADGVATWSNVGGVAGTAMTLNASGLGVGVSPGVGFDLQQTSPMARITGTSTTGYSSLTLRNTGASGRQYGITLGGSGTGTNAGNLVITDDTASATRFVLDASGNVGIGVTPSAWATIYKAIELPNGSSIWGQTDVPQLSLQTNAFLNSSFQWIYKTTAAASNYRQTAGQHLWFTAPSGTAGNAITFTQAMTLDASGNLLVGTTNTSASAGVGFKANYSATVPAFSVVVNDAAGTGAAYTLYNTNAAAYRFYVANSGTIFATNTTISAISDQRLKENVQDIDVGLGAILALKPRKFDWKAGKGKDIKGDRGFIAQEFETVFPNLIDEWKDESPEGEAPYKSVRQDLIPVLVKAIQELTARVQTLETR